MSRSPNEVGKSQRRFDLPSLVPPPLELSDMKSPHRPPKTPTRELMVWRNHCVKLLLESEREKQRFELAEREKTQKKAHEQSTDSQKSDKKRSSSSRLTEVKSKRAKEISELAAKAELTAKEHEAYLKQLQEQRLSEHQDRARNNRSRLTEVQECRSQLLQAEDFMRSQQLQEMKRKLERSREAHSAVLHSRAQSAAKKRKNTASFSPRKQDDTSRILSYVQKLQSASKKHTQAKLQEAAQREAQRRAKEQKVKRVALNLKFQKQKVEDWTKSIENRHHSFTVSRTSDRPDRTEVQKEREDLAQLKRDKMQVVRASRQSELLYKWAETGKRIEAMKQQRALSVERHRDVLHAEMLEREKTYRLLQEVAKSPQSRRAQQLLKDLGHTN